MDNIIAEPVVVMPVERKDGTYALRLCLTQGQLTAGMMKTVMETMSKFKSYVLACYHRTAHESRRDSQGQTD